MKKLFLVLSLFVTVICNAQYSDLTTSQKTRMEQSIERDENGVILGFDYLEIKDEVGNENFIKYLLGLMNVSSVICHFNDTDLPVKYTIDNQTNQMRHATYEDGPGDPSPHAYFDKKNWRRPGCKPKTGAICLITY